MSQQKLQIRLKDNEQNFIIRKYLDYPKFLSLITTNSLYFARPEEFEDPLDSLFPEYSGIKKDILSSQSLKKVHYDSAQAIYNMILSNLNKIYPNSPTREQIFIVFENHLLPVALKYDNNDILPNIQSKIWDIVDLYINNRNDETIDKLNDFYIDLQIKHFIDTRVLNRKRALINCWYIGECESDLMWKTYAKNDGIMIQTNVQKLLSLDFDKFISENATCVIDKVKYIDLIQRDKEKNNLHLGRKEGNSDILCHYFEKNTSYQDEKELRIVIAEDIKNCKALLDRKNGTLIKINLPISEFIEKIIISPYTLSFYKTTLYETLIKMNLKELANKIETSSIQKLHEQIL